MSPRNLDDTNCKDNVFSGESEDSQLLDFTPNLLHKKHKVIKLVKAQLVNIQEKGLLDNVSGANDHGFNYSELASERMYDESNTEAGQRMLRGGSVDNSESESEFGITWLKFPYVWLLILLLTMFLFLLGAAWISAGPLSNTWPHTPIPWISLVKTDDICALEKKYLLRWSTSNYLE